MMPVDRDDRLQAFHQYRGLLFSIAYRMLGSVADAEDMLQETFLRWEQARDTEVQSSRAFLVTIISRLCLNHLQSARVQREEYPGQWLPEPLVTGSGGDPSEHAHLEDSLSMAFLVLLERLTPQERAVFLLRRSSITNTRRSPGSWIRVKPTAGRSCGVRGSTWRKCGRDSRHRRNGASNYCRIFWKRPPQVIWKNWWPCFRVTPCCTPMAGGKVRRFRTWFMERNEWRGQFSEACGNRSQPTGRAAWHRSTASRAS